MLQNSSAEFSANKCKGFAFFSRIGLHLRIKFETLAKKGGFMTGAKPGDRVKIHYAGTLDNGEVFDSTQNREPLQFVIGGGQVFKGLEDGVVGMEVGESKQIHIKANEAFGKKKPELFVSMKREELPETLELKIGLKLKMKTPNDSVIPVKVKEVTDKKVVLDANHPLAGKDLNYKIKLLQVA
jgi:FKBP-type peptidyl-prolyl cis-trans isomerase 2